MTITDAELAAHLKSVVNDGFELNPTAFAPLAGWNSILHQVFIARHYLGRLSTREPELGDLDDVCEMNAIFVAFLTTYGKCFVSAEGRSIKLKANDVFKGNSSARQGHDRIIELRHSYAAHNAESGMVRPTMAVKEEADRFVIQHLLTLAVPLNEFEAFDETLNAVERYAVLRLNKHLDALQLRLGKPVVLD